MLRIRHLGRGQLDFELRSFKGIRLRLLERPGLWMTESMLSAIVEDLRVVARRAVPEGPLDYGVLLGERAHLERALICIAYSSDTGRPTAFNALAQFPVQLNGERLDVLHIGLVLVDPIYRRSGFSWLCCGLAASVALLRNALRPVWSSNVTQVPAAYGMFTERFARVFPGTPGSVPTATHRAIATELMRWHRPAFGVGDDASFDSERFVIRNSYTGGSDHLKKPFGEAAKHRNPIYNDCCRADLDYARGDDFLQIGQLTLGSIGGYYLRTLGRFSSLSKLAHAWTGTPHLPGSVSMRRNYDTEAPNRG